jgi:hypothetical protein
MAEVAVLLLEASSVGPASTMGAVIAVAISAAFCTGYWERWN